MSNLVPLNEGLFDLRCNINEATPEKYNDEADYIAKRIGERLTVRLDILNMSSQDLARMLIQADVIKATSDCTVRHIRIARRKPSINLLFWIAKFTNVQPGYYLDDDNQKWQIDDQMIKNVRDLERQLR